MTSIDQEIESRMTLDVVTKIIEANIVLIKYLVKQGKKVIIFDFPDPKTLLNRIKEGTIPAGYKLLVLDTVESLKNNLGRYNEMYQEMLKTPRSIVFITSGDNYIYSVNILA